MTRPLRLSDAPDLADVLQANRTFLAPWQPLRSDSWFTVEGQRDVVIASLAQQEAGTSLPLVITDAAGGLVGTITLQSIIRGAFQSCSVGYWLSRDAQGRGLATTALREATTLAFDELRLHRVQAETLTHNERSKRVLLRVGFTQYGEAPQYLHIAGRWQDNLLYQLLTPSPDRVVTA